LSSLFVLAEQRQFDLSGKSIGIIGCGNVGSILRTFMDELEVTCLVYDPPRQDSGDPDDFAGLDEVLQADIISLHVPLTDEGPYATRELVDSGFLSRLRTEVVFINTSRGDVVDEKALAGFIDTNPENSVVLDVWKNEPDINIGLLDKAAITTPHIAGYSLDARLNGTRMVYSKVCEAMNLQENGPDTSWLPEKGVISLDLSASEKDTDAIQMAVLASYDVRTDSAVLRQIEKVDKEQRGGYFSDLRKYYPVRREFPSMTVSLPEGYDRLEQKLKNLGFRIG
jgi:erythronate-4-phosphate dehydrogenase